MDNAVRAAANHNKGMGGYDSVQGVPTSHTGGKYQGWGDGKGVGGSSGGSNTEHSSFKRKGGS